MDLDIEMEIDDVQGFQDVAQIPEAYTVDIITGEEQVRAADCPPHRRCRRPQAGSLTIALSRNPARSTT